MPFNLVLFWYRFGKGVGMTLFLGIDGGGSGCRAAVCDADGRVLRTGKSGPANIATDLEGARRNVMDAAVEALPSGATFGDVVAVMGLAGANVLRCMEQFRKGLTFRQLRIETDALIATKGALGHRDGIVAAIGTGSVFASQVGGTVRQVGGWGLVLGDEGSGAWIGRAILARCLQALDGAKPLTALLSELLDEYGGGDGIVSFATQASPAEFAALAPRVIRSSDPAARAIVDQADVSVSKAIGLLQPVPALPVVFLGGLGQVFSARLAGRWPVVQPYGDPLHGALLLARGAA
jgi:glucosamine kinase